MKSEDRFDSLIRFYAEKCGRDPRQVKRQIRQESNFDHCAVSGAGAQGLMQFMLPTWKEFGGGDPTDALRSIQRGCLYMERLEKRYGSLAHALAAYNWGMGHLDRLLVVHEEDWQLHLPVETRAYVKACMNYEGEILTC